MDGKTKVKRALMMCLETSQGTKLECIKCKRFNTSIETMEKRIEKLEDILFGAVKQLMNDNELMEKRIEKLEDIIGN